MECAVLGRDRMLVDRGVTIGHEAVGVEFPVFVAVRSKPRTAIDMEFVGEPHRNPVSTESPQLFYEAVVELPRPFPGEEGFDGRATVDELVAVPPVAVGAVGKRHLVGIARIPAVLRLADCNVKWSSGGRVMFNPRSSPFGRGSFQRCDLGFQFLDPDVPALHCFQHLVRLEP